MPKDVIQADTYDRRITFQKNVPLDNGQGGFDPNWTDYYTCWADIQTFPHGRGITRAFLYSQIYPTVTLTISIRFQPTYPIVAAHRIKYIKSGVAHYYQIFGVENLAEANVEIILLCSEWQAKGSS